MGTLLAIRHQKHDRPINPRIRIFYDKILKNRFMRLRFSRSLSSKFFETNSENLKFGIPRNCSLPRSAVRDLILDRWSKLWSYHGYTDGCTQSQIFGGRHVVTQTLYIGRHTKSFAAFQLPLLRYPRILRRHFLLVTILASIQPASHKLASTTGRPESNFLS